MDVGAELTAARQRAGLSREQVSQRTKVQVAKIEALEQNAFDRLPGGIYLDGIIRAYAHEVGLTDADPLLAQARAASSVALGASPHTEGLAHPAPADNVGFEEFLSEAPDLVPSGGDAFDEFATEATASPHPVSTSLPHPVSPSVPGGARRSRFRDAVLPVALIALFIGGAALGAFLVHRAEREGPDPVASRPAEIGNSPQADRRDVGTTGSVTPDAGAPRNGTAKPARPLESAAPVTIAPPAAPPVAATPGPVARSSAAAATTRPPEREPRAADATSPIPVADLSGEWTLNTQVESSSLSTYEGLQLGYRLQLEQRGNAVRGNGRKVLENGKAIRGRGQTPITVEGTVEGDRLRLTFSERGARRPSAGMLVLHREGTDGWRGRFSSNAARSAGRAEARRP